MKIGVIGGSGFIGSHLVDKLIQEGHEVTVFDIMQPHRNDVRHIYLDVLDLTRMVIALAGGFDAVYMLAAMANVNDVYNNPVEAGHLNIMAVVNTLEAARRNAIGRVLLSSTVWVYVLADEEYVDEETPLHPSRVNHVYIATKLAAELYSLAYASLYGVQVTILRYGIPYGPRGRTGTVITNFLENALRGNPLTITGDGSQYRCFIHVDDLVEGNVAALQPIAVNGIYNLEGMRPVTIREVAETVAKVCGNVQIQYQQARPGDFQGRIASNQKSFRDLGWAPKVDLEEGVRRMLQWSARERSAR